jgi:hypothetical protein
MSLMNAGEDRSAGSDSPEKKPQDLDARAEAKVTTFLRDAKGLSGAVVDAVRFVLFFLFILTAIVRFWLLCVTVVLHLVRVALHLLTIPLRTAAGAYPPRPAGHKQTFLTSHLGITLYFELVKPIVHAWFEAIATFRSFWHYTIARKTLVVIVVFFGAVVPASYLIPRPHTVQILDNNVLNNHRTALSVNPVGYLIHAIDLDDPLQTREYINENAWWLGKLNSQGLKARLVPGRYYRLWVIGLRWWVAPTLYPNIIFATEVDAQGNELEHPSTFIPSTTNGH